MWKVSIVLDHIYKKVCLTQSWFSVKVYCLILRDNLFPQAGGVILPPGSGITKGGRRNERKDTSGIQTEYD